MEKSWRVREFNVIKNDYYDAGMMMIMMMMAVVMMMRLTRTYQSTHSSTHHSILLDKNLLKCSEHNNEVLLLEIASISWLAEWINEWVSSFHPPISEFILLSLRRQTPPKLRTSLGEKRWGCKITIKPKLVQFLLGKAKNRLPVFINMEKTPIEDSVTNVCINPCDHPSIRPSVNSSIHRFIHPSIHPHISSKNSGDSYHHEMLFSSSCTLNSILLLIE